MMHLLICREGENDTMYPHFVHCSQRVAEPFYRSLIIRHLVCMIDSGNVLTTAPPAAGTYNASRDGSSIELRHVARPRGVTVVA